MDYYELSENPASIESSSSKKKNGKKKMAVLGAAYTIDPNYRTPEEVLASLFRSSDDASPYANNKPRPKPITKHVRASM